MTTTDHALSRSEELHRPILRHIDDCQAHNAMKDSETGTLPRRARRTAQERTPRCTP
ncbi:hypothetical protein [Streptomyces lasiicapitis]|uniref:Uncharacterized protein n=1 Tax=Streptomyces lasiicapitis TaxID=1923961 RepID=A0ABQ2MUJ1_9ACTN|nr:hypothetical protein [Streptomyces lasiicapitis]GGO59044.1 hypothetical protein GCM10012286_79740 [Streptomyces lasiicapitis]